MLAQSNLPHLDLGWTEDGTIWGKTSELTTQELTRLMTFIGVITAYVYHIDV
jgi:hypothetical protein